MKKTGTGYMRHAGAFAHFAGALAGNPYLLRRFIGRSFSARHAELFLGWLWPLVNTAVQFVLYWVIFAKVIGMKLARTPDVSFGFFLMAGLVPYIAFSDGVTRAASLFRSNRSLIQRVSFPVEVFLIGDLLATLGYHGLELIVVAGICVVAGLVSVSSLGWLLAGLAVLLIWLGGFGVCVSVLGAFIPDVREMLNLALLLLFYGAPIVYPLEMIHSHWLRLMIELNPVTVIVQLVRAGLLGLAAPPAQAILVCCVGGAVLLAAGIVALEKVRLRLADVV